MKSSYRTIARTCALLALIHATSAFAAGEAKNVIFFLGDGMGPTVVTASRIYKYGEAGKLTMETLPRTARIKTYSLDAQTTDSAPSMAAYMTGVKMRNDVLAMDGSTKSAGFAPTTDANGVSAGVNNCPATGNGSPSTTILEMAIAKGKATGVVSTARLTHATPAATYAHVCHRDAEYEIARQAVPGGVGYNAKLGNGVDVLMGGVSYFWTPFPSSVVTSKKGRNDGRDLTAEMKAKGYTYVTNKAQLDAAPSSAGTRILALFDQAAAQGHMSYELDRIPANEPSIAEMTAKAIDVLSKNTNGYFLMVEGGRIDHALHGTNAARALADTIAFDDAIKTALSKVDLSNTLVVVTADHDHTMTFNGYASKGNKILGKTDNWQTPGVLAKSADGKPFTTLVFGNGSGNGTGTASGGVIRKAVRDDLTQVDTTTNDYIQEYGVQLPGTAAGGETHGSGDVMLFAAGAGRTPFKGTLDNTAVFGLLKSAFGF
jgi:alkaline phosphatase